MTAGSVLGVLAILLIAAVPNLAVFMLGWLLAGVAMAATFYASAFAAITRWWGPDRVRALTIVTLAGGLASTVFAPLTAALTGHLTWRQTYAVLAVILAAITITITITIPAHALALRAPWPTVPPAPPTGDRTPIARSRPFLLLAAASTLSGFSVSRSCGPDPLTRRTWRRCRNRWLGAFSDSVARDRLSAAPSTQASPHAPPSPPARSP